ncbi:MAG: cupredoxin domain-containing protein [Patescibacteria group bacterium]
MNKSIIISIGVAILLIGGAIAYTSNTVCVGNSCSASSSQNNQKVENVKIVGEKQIIEISVKGGYTPRKTIAKAGVPTILRMKTNGTFDCSSSLMIPQLNYRKILSSSGVEDIEIPALKATGVLRGLCSMGMYNFEVDFQ